MRLGSIDKDGEQLGSNLGSAVVDLGAGLVFSDLVTTCGPAASSARVKNANGHSGEEGRRLDLL